MRKSAFAHRATNARSAESRGNLSRFHKSRKLRRESTLRMQVGDEDTGFAPEVKEAKAETFEISKNLPRKRKKHMLWRSYNYRGIWSMEAHKL
jgi:hypothetical protein